MKQLSLERRIFKLLARAKEQLQAAAFAMPDHDEKRMLWHLKDRIGVYERDATAFMDAKRLLKAKDQIADAAETVKTIKRKTPPSPLLEDALDSASDMLDALLQALEELSTKEKAK